VSTESARSTAIQESLFPLAPEVVPPRTTRRGRRATPEAAAPGGATRPPIEIRTSKRRRKTATAYWSDESIVVVLPAHVRGTAKTELVDWLVARVLANRPRSRASDEVLAERARVLADRYVPGARWTSVRWVTNQEKRWGSCTAETGEVRLSHRLRGVPDWVLDAVLVHELAHLVHPDHSAAFHALADRYPRQAEASVFLDGFALGLEAPGAATRR
jgi:predicted metal-dependent hydrolase